MNTTGKRQVQTNIIKKFKINAKIRMKKQNYLGNTRVELQVIAKKESSCTITDNLISCDIDNFRNHFCIELEAGHIHNSVFVSHIHMSLSAGNKVVFLNAMARLQNSR